jgi:hypothetical protein
MADHLIGKFWGLWGALMAALLTLALIAPPGAEAAGPGSGALGQLGALVPVPAQSAVSAALAQVPSAGGAGASAAAVPNSPPSVPVVVPPPPPPVPAVARPTPAPAPANPASAAPVPVPVPVPVPQPARIAGQTVSAPAQSVPQPDAAVQAALSEANPSSSARPKPALGGRTPAHRIAHPRAHRHAGSPRWASAASAQRAPIARPTAALPWSPVSVLETSRRGTQPAAPARRADSRSESGRARHLAPPRSRPGGAVTTAPLAVPLSAVLPPGGAEGSAAGAGGAAAGAAAAALLALVGLCILRALLPGLLGLGLAPVQSAFLVSRLERPG